MKPEIIQKRNLNAKHFQNPDGSITGEFHIGMIHYIDKQTKLLENVDCQFIPTNYGWEMRKNNYELEIPARANGWFKFINSFGYESRGKVKTDKPDEVVAIKPLGITNVKGTHIEKPEWKGKGIVLYKDAYAPDIDLEVMARNTGFVKEVVINKKPSDLSKDLEFAFEIDIDGFEVKPKKKDYMNLRATKVAEFKGLKNKELLEAQKKYEDVLERETWNKSSVLETSDSIILEKLRKTWFRKFNLYDSEGNQGVIKVRLENIDGKIILTKVLDKTFLENAIYPVRTDTTTSYYAGAGDGSVQLGAYSSQPSQANWDTVHDSAAGDGVSYIQVNSYLSGIKLNGTSNWTIFNRNFYPCDTSGLGAGATISAAVLKLYYQAKDDDYNGDGYDYITVVKTFQASSSELVVADYEDCGYDSGTETGGRAKYLAVKGSADIDITGIGATYNDFTLNAIGRGWINKTGTTMLGLREGHDIEDNFPGDPGETTKYSGFASYTSEQTDTSKDPYLSVTYTAGASDTGNMFMMF